MHHKQHIKAELHHAVTLIARNAELICSDSKVCNCPDSPVTGTIYKHICSGKYRGGPSPTPPPLFLDKTEKFFWGDFVAMCSYVRLWVAMCSYVWLCVRTCSYVWLCVAMCSYVWLCVAMCSCVWLWVAMCSYVCIRVAMCGYV